MTRPFVIITTRLPPAICGIGTYSAILRKHWPGEERPVHFLVVAEAAEAELLDSRDAVVQFAGEPARLREALHKIGSADVLLHYAGRAYQRFGCPTWLPGVISSWKRQFPQSALTIFFHELPGEMPISSRYFLLGRINAWIIRRLARVADTVATNSADHLEQLQKITGRTDTMLLPVGSNIEREASDGGPRLQDEFVLFGLPFGRLQTVELFARYFRPWTDAGLLRKLHIIGPDDDKFSAREREVIAASIDPTVVIRHGVLPSPAVSRLLRTATVALTNVSPQTWSKSGAFMACASHRCAVVRVGAQSNCIPLAYTVVADEVATIAPQQLEQRTTSLAQWYQENADWSVIARRLAITMAPHDQQSR